MDHSQTTRELKSSVQFQLILKVAKLFQSWAKMLRNKVRVKNSLLLPIMISIASTIYTDFGTPKILTSWKYALQAYGRIISRTIAKEQHFWWANIPELTQIQLKVFVFIGECNGHSHPTISLKFSNY